MAGRPGVAFVAQRSASGLSGRPLAYRFDLDAAGRATPPTSAIGNPTRFTGGREPRREVNSLREPNCRQPGKTQRRSQPNVDRDGPTNSRHRSDQQARLCVLAAAGSASRLPVAHTRLREGGAGVAGRGSGPLDRACAGVSRQTRPKARRRTPPADSPPSIESHLSRND